MVSPTQLATLVRATAAARDQWRPVVRFTPRRRWFHRLGLTDDYETWLLTWLPGQRTGFHDHGGASGAFAVAQGDLRETLASPGSSRLRHRTTRRRCRHEFRRPARARGGQHQPRARRQRACLLTSADSDAAIRTQRLWPDARADRPRRGRLVSRPAGARHHRRGTRRGPRSHYAAHPRAGAPSGRGGRRAGRHQAAGAAPGRGPDPRCGDRGAQRPRVAPGSGVGNPAADRPATTCRSSSSARRGTPQAWRQPRCWTWASGGQPTCRAASGPGRRRGCR